MRNEKGRNTSFKHSQILYEMEMSGNEYLVLDDRQYACYTSTSTRSHHCVTLGHTRGAVATANREDSQLTVLTKETFTIP